MMLIWDKGRINYHHWHKLKHTYGIYFVTLEKSNSAAEIRSVNQLARTDPIPLRKVLKLPSEIQ